MQGSAAQKMARRIVRADDLDAFFAANRQKLTPEAVVDLKEEVDRLVKVDLTKAAPLAVATHRLGQMLDDPVSLAHGEAALAQAYLYGGRLADAEPLFTSAIARLRDHGRRVDAAALERQLVSLLYRQGRSSEALQVARHARRTLRQAGEKGLLGQLETNVGNVYYYCLSRYRTALTYYDRAKAIFTDLGDEKSLALVEYNRGNALFELDLPNLAAETYERAEKLHDSAGQTALSAQCSFAHAFTLSTLGRYAEALRRFYGARERLLKVGDGPLAAWCALLLAELHKVLNVEDEAISLADQALDEFTRLEGHELEIARARVLRAKIFERRRDFERAEAEIAAAIEAFDRLGSTAFGAEARLGRAELALARGDAETCERLAGEAEGVYRSARLGSWVARARLTRAEAIRRRGGAHQALRIVRGVSVTGERLDDPWLKCRAAALLGELELDRGQHSKGVAALEKAVSGIEGLRLRLRPGEARAAFLGDKLSPYERLVAVHLERGGAENLRTAFRYVEMAKSRSLADLMMQHLSSSRMAEAVPGDQKVREQLTQRLEELRWYSSRIEGQHEKGDTRNSRLDAHLRSQLARCESELASLFRRLELEDSQLASMLGAEPTSIDELASGLAADDAAVEFFSIGKQVSAFVITRDGATAHVGIAKLRDIESHLSGFRFQIEKFSLGNRYASEHKAALRRCADNHLEALYRSLIQPIEREIEGRNLLIIPHGVLHYVPMHALRAPDGTYLIEHREIAYAPSATVHKLCARKPAPNGTRGLLGVGLGDDRTPHISNELAAIGRLFPDSVLLEGAEASKAAFLERAPRHRFLHLATHGHFRQDNPLFSSVRLVDGPLNFYDLFDLSLDAELVTLSACDTGINKLAPGDELSGLMRGFLYAGAPSLLVSLWAVNDESTSHLMRSFYGHLQKGATKRAALRLAELEALDKYGHPYYWAPFVLMGKP